MREDLLLEITEAVEKAQRQIRKAHETWNRNQRFLEENYSETDEEESKSEKKSLQIMQRREDLTYRFRNNICKDLEKMDLAISPLIDNRHMKFFITTDAPDDFLYDDSLNFLHDMASTPALAIAEVETYYNIAPHDYFPLYRPRYLLFHINIAHETFCMSLMNPDRLDIPDYNSKTPYIVLAEFPLENYDLEKVQRILVDFVKKEIEEIIQICIPDV